MCNDMVTCLKNIQKKAMRTLESIMEDSDKEFTISEIDKVHHLLEIVKDSEKLIAHGEETEG